MSKWFTASRIVLVLHAIFVVATVVAIFIATVSNSLPVSWQKTAAAAVVLLGAIASATVAVHKWLDGNSKWEVATAGTSALSVVSSVPESARTPDGPVGD